MVLTKRSSKFVLWLSGLAVAAAACGGGSGGATAGDSGEGPTEVKVAASHADSLPFMAILQVAVDKGWFEEQEINVSLVSGGGGGNTLRVAESGGADIAIAGGPSVVLAASRPDSNLQMVGSWFPVNDFLWITSDSGATLENATLGYSSAGSTTEMVVKAMQARLGDRGTKVDLASVGGMGDNWAAVKAGEITAGWAMHPFVTDKVRNEDAHALVGAREVVGDFPADLVAANTDFAEQQPEALKAFFRGAQRAFSYVVENPNKAAKDLAPILGMDTKLLAQGLNDTPELEKAYSLKIYPPTLRNLSDIMLTAGEISEPVNWSRLLDQQYLPQGARADL